jgi:hypothetical protein
MAENGVEEIGRVFVVDPNPIQNDIIPPEDMFIYVKFSAYPKNRVTYNGDSFDIRGVEDEVNFISTKIRYNNDGKLDPNPQQTYATTDWTNIGGFKGEDTRSSGILEGFGIKSINIVYNASLVPVVDITFTDVRGSALFDILGNDDIRSPYSIFFKMPYPVFKLSVKGYFGQKVDYCLHMTNWNSQFDGSTGNFDISANFLGFQQAFLNDMVIGNIVGVVNTKEGYGKLNEIYDRTDSNFGLSSSGDGKSLEELQRVGKLNIRKLDDFFIRISKLKVESESLKDDLDTFKTLKFLNGKKSILKELQTFIGPPIEKESDPTDQSNNDGTTKDYLKINNSIKKIETSGINDRLLELKKNYFSIRDYLLINSISIGNFKNYIITLNDIVTKYNEYITDDRNQEYTNTDSLTNLSKSAGNKSISKGKLLSDIISDVTTYLNTPKDKQFIELFKIDDNSEDKWKNFVIDSQKPNDELILNQSFSLQNVLSYMVERGDEIYLKKNYKGGNDVNNNFDINNFNKEVSNGTYYNPNMLRDTVVVVADFREIREKLENEIQSLESIIKSQQQIVQEDLNEKLFNKSNDSENEFKPTIKTCFEVLANNTQAMVETIYEITKSSENLGSQRNSLIKGRQTDIPETLLNSLSENNKSIAWPSFYTDVSGNEPQKEIYIGDVQGVTRTNFPEYDFVERVFDNFISKREELQQITKTSVLNNGTDTDNWFPINPMDYDVNPFLKLRFLNSEPEIIEYFTEQMLTRIALWQNYSNFDTTTGGSFEDYAKFDAINAFETVNVNNQTVLVINKIIDRIKNDGDKFGANSLIGQTNFFKNIVVGDDGVITYALKEGDGVQPKIGNIEFGLNYNNANIDYILFDNKEIINNSSKLWDKIQTSNEYKKFFPNDQSKFTKKEYKGDLIYETKYVASNNLYTNNIYNVWGKSIGNNLLKSSNIESENNITTFGNVILENIDKKLSSGDTTGIYLNKTYFTDDTETTYEETFTGGKFYTQQTIFGSGYLLLSTIPYRDFKNGFINSLFPGDKFFGARIVKLPELYVYYLGSILWRYNENTDPLVWTDYTNFQTNKNNYPTKISYYKSIPSEEKPLEDELINLPISVKNALINKFKEWVKLNFNSTQTGKFESELDNYVSDIPNNIEKTKNYLLRELTKTTELIILNPKIFDKNRKNKLFITINKIDEYINKFSELFSKKSTENSDTSGNNVEEEKQKVSEKNKKEIKLQIYNYFKNINDKWVAGSEEGKSFNVCGAGNNGSTNSTVKKPNNLIDYFRFIDRGWSDIGDQATINLNSFLSLGNNQDTSVYFFMSKLLRDSNFLFQILPSYIDYKDEKEVAKMFRPFTTLESPDSSGPVYCCIYVGGASQVLDIKETNNYYFNNDGYAFKNGEIPSDMGDTNNAIEAKDKRKLVAFRVAFGAQNQTIFKNVSLNQQEHKETGEYFNVLSEIIDKRGATQKVYQGTDLLRLFKTRSYTCQVDSLGCMNIQPLMYFDLQNVPFFNGAYLITSVSHSITPNHMTTNFKGVRQSKYITPPTTSITADIDIDLNETNEIPKIEFSNLNNTNQIYSIGVDSGVANQVFEVNQITIETLNILGVSTSGITAGDIDFIKTTINGSTNADVAMFFANALVNSNNFLNSEDNWNNGEFSKNEVKFPSNVEFSGETKAYQISNIQFSPSDNQYFTYTPTTTATTTSSENQETAYYFPNTPSSLIEYDKVNVDPESVLKIKLDNLTYYNIFQGDEYMYRPVGFLYMIGRKQYFDLFGSDAINSPQNYYQPPFQRSFEIAYKVWTNIKDGNGNTGSGYSKTDVGGRLGSFTSFNQSRLASQQFKTKSIEESAKVFQKVLNIFTHKGEPLIDFFNP